jgi:putative molybdopterin biosynthesis protein
LLQHLLQAEGLALEAVDTWSVPPEDSHLAVAAAVASGAADTGLGIEAAAARFGLGFVPLIEEDYYLVCLRDALDHPAVQKLQQVLQGPAWRDTLADVPGYAAGRSGQVLSLTRALPWWNFRTPKAHAQPAAGPLPSTQSADPTTPTQVPA